MCWFAFSGRCYWTWANEQIIWKIKIKKKKRVRTIQCEHFQSIQFSGFDFNRPNIFSIFFFFISAYGLSEAIDLNHLSPVGKCLRLVNLSQMQLRARETIQHAYAQTIAWLWTFTGINVAIKWRFTETIAIKALWLIHTFVLTTVRSFFCLLKKLENWFESLFFTLSLCWILIQKYSANIFNEKKDARTNLVVIFYDFEWFASLCLVVKLKISTEWFR